MVDVCYMPGHDEAFFGQVEEASCLQAIILTGNFNHPNNIQKSNTVGHKQPRRFLECVDVSFLAQVIEVLIDGDALLNLILTGRKSWLGMRRSAAVLAAAPMRWSRWSAGS